MTTHTAEALIAVEKAQEIILQNTWDLESEMAGLINALGKTLAEDINADADFPAYPAATVDGYALNAMDTAGASAQQPSKFTVLCDLRKADTTHKPVQEGTAIGVCAGTPLPAGANAVIPYSDTSREDAILQVKRSVHRGENVKQAGEEIRKGETLIPRGTLIGPKEMGIIAALGKPGVSVARKPKIAVVTVGNDAVDPADDHIAGKVRNSVRYSLVGQILSANCELGPLVHAQNQREAISSSLTKALRADAVIISGGLNLGEHDFVREVLSKTGDLHISRVAVKPGKPFAFATIDGKPIFALSSDPVSSLVAFEAFVRPALLKMLGRNTLTRPTVTAKSASYIKHSPMHKQFICAKTYWDKDHYRSETVVSDTNSSLKSTTHSNSLMIVEEQHGDLKRGEFVEVIML